MKNIEKRNRLWYNKSRLNGWRRIQMAKKSIDKSKLLTKIMAGLLAGMMVIAFAGTLIYCLVAA